MAITTTNGRLAIMELEDVWEPGLPMSPGTLGQDDQQQLLWGFPEILWGELVEVFPPITDATLEFVFQRNAALDYEWTRNVSLDY